MREESTSSSARVRVALFVILLAQVFFGALQVNDHFTRGHNGWNSSAYHQSAKNSLRWERLFPLQYYTGTEPQPDAAVYTHHPLGMHLHNTAAMWVFGDHRAVVRGVAALFGVLAVWALFFVVRRLWGDDHAILAAAIYVVLPINAIFVNMANHISGFTVFALLTLYAYVRLHHARELRVAQLERGDEAAATPWRGWLAKLYVAYAFAAFWDWPANYLALILAIHWLASGLRRARLDRRAWKVELASLAGFCVVVLAMFFGHFALVKLATGGLEELLHVASARQGTGGFSWGHHLRTVPLLMFSWPIVALALAWLVAFMVRLVGRRLAIRDLIPFAFAVAGVTHYVVFRQSAVVHEFWGWYSLPFVAIACATSLLAGGRFIVERLSPKLGGGGAARVRARAIAAFVLTLFMMPFALHAARVIPDGRRVGGSMWFVAPVRGPEPTSYDSGRMELSFAEWVNERTTREAGVLVDSRLYRLVPEPRWEITLDREVRRTHVIPRAPAKAGAISGWVYVGRLEDIGARTKEALATRHPFTEVGPFFMVDLREERVATKRFDLVPGARTLSHTLFVSPFEPPLVVSPRRAD
jgi:4-amino-4-deoxy-L-arabinose transferase-like glycosyltransferase